MKYVLNLDTWQLKALLREILKDLNKRYTMFMDWKIKYCRDVLSKITQCIHFNPYPNII